MRVREQGYDEVDEETKPEAGGDAEEASPGPEVVVVDRTDEILAAYPGRFGALLAEREAVEARIGRLNTDYAALRFYKPPGSGDEIAVIQSELSRLRADSKSLSREIDFLIKQGKWVSKADQPEDGGGRRVELRPP
jgi:hypothetical protein